MAGKEGGICHHGPRQSGKTTLLRLLAERVGKAVFINFEDPDVLEAFERDPKG
jgi:predicted AAA+ superfamily ATPase